MENLQIEYLAVEKKESGIRGFKYSPQTGNVYRSVPIGRNGSPRVIRGKNPGGYLQFQFRNKMISCHRAAFLIMGIDPTGVEVDHINGVRTDNRWINLRLVTSRGNATNKSFHREGRKVGARFCKQKNKWKSEIIVDGKGKHLGFFSTEDEAHGAYMKAFREEKNGLEINSKIRQPRQPSKKGKGLYISVIKSKGKAYYLGQFSTLEESENAYKKAKENIAIGIFPTSLRGENKTHRARVTIGGKRISLGRFSTREEAEKAQADERERRLGI